MKDSNLIDNEFIEYLNSLLLEAAENGHVNIVRVLLEHGAEINAVVNDIATPLYMAAQEGHANIVKLLLEHEANTETKASNGHSSLSMAVFNKHINVINLLLKAGANTEFIIKEGFTPIHVANIGGYFDGVKSLLEHGANKDLRILEKTPLDIAKENGNEKISLLLQGHSIENKNRIDELLCTVASYGDAAMATQFLNLDANANAKCSNAMSPLEISTLAGYQRISDILISYGADIKSKADIAIKSFALSAINGDVLSVALALKSVPEIAKELDRNEVLNIAKNGRQDVLKLILSGLDVFCAQTEDTQFTEVCGKEGFVETSVEIS
jgi:ankyrin repeat protein